MSRDFLHEIDLLRQFEQDVELAGLVGEKKNSKVIFLAAVSAKMQKPLNVSVGGVSSAGKNYLMAVVARFIPGENQKFISGMTPKVLMHAEEDEFQHKAVFIAEYEGVAGADFAVRTMQSEHCIEWEFVDTSQGIKKKTKRVKGPVAFIQATTRVTLHPENETRLLFCQMDESAEQTRAINERQALEAEKKTIVCPPDVHTAWHDFIRSLEAKPVLIPFAHQLFRHLPDNRIRSRRDFPKLLALIETSAFLHQHMRGRNADGDIVAAPQDYFTAKELFEHCYLAGPESKVGELVRAAKKTGVGEFVVADLVQQTGWGKSKTYQVLARAEELGCIGDGTKHGWYRFLCDHPEELLDLPAKIRLTADVFRISTQGAAGYFHNSADEGSTSPRGKSEEPLGGIPDGKAENGAIPCSGVAVSEAQEGIEEEL
jgi:hypothetical protein